MSECKPGTLEAQPAPSLIHSTNGERDANSHLTMDGSPEEALPGGWGAAGIEPTVLSYCV